MRLSQSDLKPERFRDSFMQHKRYKQNMKKFTIDQQNKIKLRAELFLDMVHKQNKTTSRAQSLQLQPPNILHSTQQRSSTLQTHL